MFRMLVKDIMKRPFIVEEDISLTEAADIMSKKGIGSLLFVSGDKIKGIVTQKDLIRGFGKHEKISRVMTSNVKTINPDDGLDRAAEIMKENKIKKLAVVEKDNLVGIITSADLLENIEDLEEEFFFE